MLWDVQNWYQAQDGKGIDLNGHDQWVEVYRDEGLEISGNQLTLTLRVYPRIT